jgi:cell wall-associated NlpC family hydrolase
MSHRHSRSATARRTRRLALLVALSTAGVGTLAAPLAPSAFAAPAVVESNPSRRQSDPVAAQAAQALATVQRFVETGDPALLDDFGRQLDEIAVAVAGRLGLDPVTLQRAWQAADVEHQTALVAALTQLGVAYRRNSSRPGVGFDCSGLTAYAWSQAGVTLTRQSSAQIRKAAPRDPSTAQAGDLVQYPGHVMLWLGVERAVVHAIQPGRPVAVDIVNNRRTLRFGDPTG